MVSLELKSSSRMPEEPDAAGEDESSLSPPSLPSWFMATRTEAASRSWTCWCFEMSSFEVYCHWGVCSQLEGIGQLLFRSHSQHSVTQTPHLQVFGQATAMFVCLAAVLALELSRCCLFLLAQTSSVARSSHLRCCLLVLEGRERRTVHDCRVLWNGGVLREAAGHGGMSVV